MLCIGSSSRLTVTRLINPTIPGFGWTLLLSKQWLLTTTVGAAASYEGSV